MLRSSFWQGIWDGFGKHREGRLPERRIYKNYLPKLYMMAFATHSDGDQARQEVRSDVIILLDRNGIDWRATWGHDGAKSLGHLVEEIDDKESTLIFYEGQLVRSCSVIRVEVLYKLNEHQTLRLHESGQTIDGSGSRARPSDFAVWEKLQGKETPYTAFQVHLRDCEFKSRYKEQHLDRKTSFAWK